MHRPGSLASQSMGRRVRCTPLAGSSCPVPLLRVPLQCRHGNSSIATPAPPPPQQEGQRACAWYMLSSEASPFICLLFSRRLACRRGGTRQGQGVGGSTAGNAQQEGQKDLQMPAAGGWQQVRGYRASASSTHAMGCCAAAAVYMCCGPWPRPHLVQVQLLGGFRPRLPCQDRLQLQVQPLLVLQDRWWSGNGLVSHWQQAAHQWNQWKPVYIFAWDGCTSAG